MPTYVKDAAWNRYKTIINNFIDTDAGKQPFVWLHKIDQMPAYGEDRPVAYIPVILEGLFHYNYIKTWANNRQRDTDSGELNDGDQVLYISSNLLKKGNFINQYGYWDFNWAEDRFIVNGQVLQPGSDTQVAQAKDEALLYFVVVQRMNPEETEHILKFEAPSTIQLVNGDGLWTLNTGLNTMGYIMTHLVWENGQPKIDY